MKRLGAGHDAALNDLMDRHAGRVFHFLSRMVGNEDDAHDLAQETFVRVFRSCKSFRADQRFSTWLYTIAANLARNHFRWRSRHPTVPLETGPDLDGQKKELPPAKDLRPDEIVISEERRRAVLIAVQRLPEELREAIVLCEWEDRSVAEAAEVLAATPKAVESRLYRARKILREQLQRWW
jgi:RNA polymerase sigma-70 factor (ECF subfamily)